MIGVYAPTNDERVEHKDRFFNNLNDIINEIGSNREIMILGDLNASTGHASNDKIIGACGENTSNNNGDKLIELCEANMLKITNGYFRHKDIHKYTWVQHTRNLKSIIDYLIIKQESRLKIQDVRAQRGPNCGSDHYLLKCKIITPYPWAT